MLGTVLEVGEATTSEAVSLGAGFVRTRETPAGLHAVVRWDESEDMVPGSRAGTETLEPVVRLKLAPLACCEPCAGKGEIEGHEGKPCFNCGGKGRVKP